MSHNPTGLHGLLQEQLYLHLLPFTCVYYTEAGLLIWLPHAWLGFHEWHIKKKSSNDERHFSWRDKPGKTVSFAPTCMG
jgi:hypothetical protein